MVQSGEGEQPPQATALGGGRDADDVHLTEAVAVLLGPVEAQHPGRVLGDEQPGRVEPRLGHPAGEVVLVHCALLGVVGEGRGVDGHDRGRVVLSIGPDRDAGRGRQRRERLRGVAAHDPEVALALPSVRRGEPRCGRVVAVGPGRPRVVVRRLQQEGRRDPPPAVIGVDREAQVAAVEQREAAAVDGDRGGPVGQRHLRRLVEGRRAVGGLARVGNPADLGDVVHAPTLAPWRTPISGEERLGHSRGGFPL